MITQLSKLRSRLAMLRHRRRSVRLGSAWSTFAAALLAGLFVVFLADWLLSMSVAQRVVLLSGYCVLLVYLVRRILWPSFRRSESILELALEVEGRHGLDSDLVAALEFEDDAATRWGSIDLRAAVIADASSLADRVDVFSGFSTTRLRDRLALLLVTVLVLATLSASYPYHAATFLDRLALGSRRYPTRTLIAKVFVGDAEVDSSGLVRGEGLVPRQAFGRELVFEVECAEEIPSSASVEIESLDGRLRRSILLEPMGSVGRFSGSLPRLTESISYRVLAGDAVTDPARVEVIDLPIVLLSHEVSLPSYAVGSAAARGLDRVDPGSRQIAVLEGATVDLAVTATNKRLTEVELDVDGSKYPLVSSDGEGRVWTLEQRDTPFRPVAKPFQYSVRVVDVDGLEVKPPLRAEIRVLPDRRPLVRAVLVSRHVLPAARPRIDFAARDDFGLARVELHIGIETPGEEPAPPTTRVIREFPAPVDRVVDSYAIDLGAFDLRKGDEVTLVVEAFDERGGLPSESARSDPLILHVTDERGVISSMNESDERSARRLDEIIQKQLGIGGSR